ncbi:MAG: hypothetical protein EBX52_07830 [Proteobacteria bacterium]|nr:hypothetical protein [Pseudomonadota bacterium]
MSKISRFAWILLALPVTPSNATVLWDNWYVVSEHDTPHSYYNEKAEISGDRAKIQVNTWIKDGRRIRSENLGASARNNDSLTPVYYNYRTLTDTGEEKVIDGTVDPKGKIFSVKNRTGIHQSKPLRAQMLPNLILASFFPVWIHQNYKRITGVQPKEFQAILEDQVEGEVPVITGTAYEMRADEFAESTRTRKLRIVFNKIVAYWWVAPSGDAVRIEVPSLERLVRKTTREKAESFLTP